MEPCKINVIKDDLCLPENVIHEKLNHNTYRKYKITGHVIASASKENDRLLKSKLIYV